MLDVHTHFVPRHLPPPDDRAAAEGWPVVRPEGDRLRVLQRGKLVRTVGREAWDVRARLAAMDGLGVAEQVVMPTPFTLLHDASPDVAIAWARAQNDVLAALVADGGGRLHGLGMLPLQDPDAAVSEATRLVDELGLGGVEIGTHAGEVLLHDAALAPVFDALEALGCAVFVHPWRPVAPERTAHHGLAFGLARAVETELAVGSLVLGGVLERRPRLRVCLAHGGAGVPAIRGRLRNGWQRQNPTARVCGDPVEALRGLWSDGLTYDPHALALAEGTFGAEHLVLGSDFPFAAQEAPVGGSFIEAERLGLLEHAAGWEARTTRNARAFLGLGSSAGAGRHDLHSVAT